MSRTLKHGAQTDGNDSSVRFLYGTMAGRALLQLMLFLRVPAVFGAFLRSPLSKPLIKRYIAAHGVPMQEFAGQTFRSFNEFFTRKKTVQFDAEPLHLISPCDGLLSRSTVQSGSTFHIKGFDYTIADFLQSPRLEAQFDGGDVLIFRLCATDYHRYCYIDSGSLEENHFIKGALYSVQPAACQRYRVYTKNRRSWTILRTEHFGNVAQIEIGAFSVGGIINHHQNASFKKGEEKGYFDLHGSTIVLLFEKGRIQLLPELAAGTECGAEFRVQSGEHIGNAV